MESWPRLLESHRADLPSAQTATMESGVEPKAQMQGVPPGTSMRENDHSDEKYLGNCNRWWLNVGPEMSYFERSMNRLDPDNPISFRGEDQNLT